MFWIKEKVPPFVPLKPGTSVYIPRNTDNGNNEYILGSILQFVPAGDEWHRDGYLVQVGNMVVHWSMPCVIPVQP